MPCPLDFGFKLCSLFVGLFAKVSLQQFLYQPLPAALEQAVNLLKNGNPVCKTAKETQIYRTVSWTLRERERAGRPGRMGFVGDWNAKVGSQEIPGVRGKFGPGVQNEVGQRLTEFCQENALVIANTLFQQHKRRFYTWTSPDGQYQNRIDYILCS